MSRDPARPTGKGLSLEARAVGLLARREHSRAELAAKLAATGASRADVDAALEAIAGRGYLSDARYAHAVARQKAGLFSRRAIAQSLKAKGVATETVAAAIEEAGVDDAAAMVALWRRRFGGPPADEREKARQMRFLQSRGFDLSAILRLLRHPPAA
jgi:regulatory protein